jgi:hypothetical protein
MLEVSQVLGQNTSPQHNVRVTDLYFSVIAAFLGIYFTKPSVIIANTRECFLLAPYEPLKNFSMLSDFDLILRTDISKFL